MVRKKTDIDMTLLKRMLIDMGFGNVDDLEIFKFISKYEKLKQSNKL